MRGLAATPGSTGASGESDRCQAPPPGGGSGRGHLGGSGCGAGPRCGTGKVLWGPAGGGPRPGEVWVAPDSSLVPSCPPCRASSSHSPGAGEHVSEPGGVRRSQTAAVLTRVAADLWVFVCVPFTAGLASSSPK